MDCARHVIGCHLTQETRVHKSFDDVASTIHQSLGLGSERDNSFEARAAAVLRNFLAVASNTKRAIVVADVNVFVALEGWRLEGWEGSSDTWRNITTHILSSMARAGIPKECLMWKTNRSGSKIKVGRCRLTPG